MFAAGVAGWVWVKVGRSTGNADPKSVYLTAAGAGIAAFVIFITLFKLVLHID